MISSCIIKESVLKMCIVLCCMEIASSLKNKTNLLCVLIFYSERCQPFLYDFFVVVVAVAVATSHIRTNKIVCFNN